jgi:NAD-dependent deacetylase
MTHRSPSPELQEAAAAIANAKSIAVLTGAGISAESGVPTFRDAQTGLWARFRPEELATARAFRRDPKLVWEWYAWRRTLVAQAAPNAGHLALVAMEAAASQFTLITQNVDGLHRRAGSQNVLEIHGNIFTNLRFEDHSVIGDDEMTDDVPPRCKRTAALAAAGSCDVMLSIGTSSVVEPAASIPSLAAQEGAVLIEINPDDTPLTPLCTYALKGKAAEILPLLVAGAVKPVS